MAETVEAAVAEAPVAETVEAAVAEAPVAEKPKKPAAAGKPRSRRSRSRRGRGKGKVKTLPRKRIVKVLSVGMEMPGKVKRTSEFGAFVDIGVGRDGLLHISELSPGRVHKVNDVVKEGDEVTVWIKKLDREKNRISLTMIPPGTKTIGDLEEGELVSGTVQRLTGYGAFIDIGLERDAMLHVKEMSEGYVNKPEDVVKIGEEIEARIIGVDRRRGRIDLSLKGLRPTEEQHRPAEANVELAPLGFVAEEEEEMPTLMELALRQALDGDLPLPGERRGGGRRKERKRRKGRRESQREIINRTLRYSEDQN